MRKGHGLGLTRWKGCLGIFVNLVSTKVEGAVWFVSMDRLILGLVVILGLDGCGHISLYLLK